MKNVQMRYVIQRCCKKTGIFNSFKTVPFEFKVSR